MKYLFVLLVIVLAYVVWRNSRIADRRPPPGRSAPGATPQEMVSCAVCAVHLPRSEAVADAAGRLFCSAEHRLAANR